MKKITELRWVRILKKWQTSGQTVRDFCSAENLSYRTFATNRRRLRNRFQASDTPEFVELALPGCESPVIVSATITTKMFALKLEQIHPSALCDVLRTLGAESCCR